MKKVLAIGILLLIVTAGAAMASATNWTIYLVADSMNGNDFGVQSQTGVKPTATDGVDAVDGSPVDYGSSDPGTKWAVDYFAGDIYGKNQMSTASYTAYTGSKKVWSFRVAGLTTSTGVIRFQFKTGTSTVLAAPAADSAMKYWVRLVSNRGQSVVRPSWATNPGTAWENGTELQLTVPTGVSAFFGELDLPLLKLSVNANPQMLSEGYSFEFIQGVADGAIPEPASLLVLGSGLVGLAGFLSRKRKV